MNRGIRIGLASAALVATLGMTALAAPLKSVQRQGRAGTPTPVERSELQVIEAPRPGAQSVKYTASAVVHYATGDVAVRLVPKAKSFVASVKVPVSVAETPGVVGVDVTVSANGNAVTLHGSGKIKSVKGSR